MEFLALDKDYLPIDTLKVLNTQWNREYYKAGDFSIQILAKDYTTDMKYIYTKDRPEVGMIQSVEYESKINGKFTQLSGFFLEKKLDDKIVYPIMQKYGNIETIARYAVDTYKADLPFQLGTLNGLGTSIAKQETGAELGKMLYDMLKTQELSNKVYLDYENATILYEVYQGIDRTQDQTANNYVTFSQDLGSLTNIKFTQDTSNYKNYAIVGGSEYVYSGDDSYRKGTRYVVVDLSGGGYKKQIYVDDTTESNEEGQLLSDFDSVLYQKGVEELLNYLTIESLEFDLVQKTGTQYLVDFDIGDLCDIIVSDLGIELQARIVEVKEVEKSNMNTIGITLGEPKRRKR